MELKTILLIEDDQPLRALYASALIEAGYKVIEANNAQDIVLKTESFSPSLIITDLVMPDYEGVEGVFKVLEVFNTPIIAISAYKKHLKMIESVVDISLEKPIQPDTLVSIVQDLLE